jgi:hypothetical protein
MTETTTPGPDPVPASVTGPVGAGIAAASHETLGQRVGDFFHRADQDAERVLAAVPGFDTVVKAHAGQVFAVASDVLALVQTADPSLAPALAPVAPALKGLEAKVIALAASAAQMASTVTEASGKTA